MARPRNEKLKVVIRRKAWQLFVTIGYDETTYTILAKACNIKRSLVQYHFPKKETLAQQFLQAELERAQQAWNFSDNDLSHSLDALYAVGTTLYESFLSDEGRALFLRDILTSRSLTRTVMPFNTAWITSHAQSTQSDQVRNGEEFEPTDETLTHFGGFYEALYKHLVEGTSYDVASGLAPVMKTIAKQLGYPMAQIYHLNPEESFGTFALSAALHRMQEDPLACWLYEGNFYKQDSELLAHV